MNKIERYLGSVVLMHAVLVMLVLMVIFAFFEFMNQLGDVDESYTIGLAALFTILKLPVYGYEVFPIVLLIGTLMGLGGLANHSELTILRVTGWSIKRILLAVMKTAMLIWLVMALIGEGVAPDLEASAKKIKLEALNKGLSIGANQGFWLKDENQYLYVEKVISDTELRGVKIFTADEGKLNRYLQAKIALYQEGSWRFKGVDSIELTQKRALIDQVINEAMNKQMPSPYTILKKSSEQMSSQFVLEPEDLTKMGMETKYLSVFDVKSQIDFLQQNDLDASQYELAFWRKLSMPIVVVAMIAVVFPLVFGSMRQVSIGQRIFLGVLVGMSFHLINQLIGNVAVVYQLPILLMTILPALLVIAASWWWLEKAE